MFFCEIWYAPLINSIFISQRRDCTRRGGVAEFTGAVASGCGVHPCTDRSDPTVHVGGVPKFEILPILAKLGFRFLADRSDYSDKFFVDESHKKQKLYTFCYRRI